ncbi:hypothetical protein BDK51DRAFT_33276, partial [Blyttiomyces helicus]
GGEECGSDSNGVGEYKTLAYLIGRDNGIENLNVANTFSLVLDGEDIFGTKVIGTAEVAGARLAIIVLRRKGRGSQRNRRVKDDETRERLAEGTGEQRRGLNLEIALTHSGSGVLLTNNRLQNLTKRLPDAALQIRARPEATRKMASTGVPSQPLSLFSMAARTFLTTGSNIVQKSASRMWISVDETGREFENVAGTVGGGGGRAGEGAFKEYPFSHSWWLRR